MVPTMDAPAKIRSATPTDAAALHALFPRLAAFDVPASRNPEDLWRGDEKLLRAWLAGDAPQCFVQVAELSSGTLAGFTLVSLRPELLSGAPSAHLEAIAVSKEAEGRGVARALIDAAEREALARGARSMTLHVFAANARARALYARTGYTEELIRCTKPLGS